jgi:hypothetical protein
MVSRGSERKWPVDCSLVERLVGREGMSSLSRRFIWIASCAAAGLAGGCALEATDSRAANGDDGFQGVGGTTSGGGAAAGSGGTTTLPPEEETEETYTAPVVSGRFIWTANPVSGRVAWIDSESLKVRTTEAGLAPTYLAAVPTRDAGESAAVVLNVGSHDATVLRARDAEIEALSLPIHLDANRLAMSRSGRFGIVWTDAALEMDVDPTEGLQDVTVLNLDEERASSQRLTVGYRPSRVFVREDEREAYVVAESGVSVLALGDEPSVLRDVPITTNPTEAAAARDVTVTRDGAYAFVRREGSPRVDVIALASGEMRSVMLRAPVTDLDLSPDGTRAFAVVRGTFAPPGGETPVTGDAGFAGTDPGAGGGGGDDAGGANAGGGDAANAGGSSGGADQGVAAGAAGVGGASGADGASGETSSGGDAAVDAGAGGESVGGAGAAGANAAGGAAAGGEGGAGTIAPPTEISEVAVFSVAAIFEDPTAFESVSIPGVFGSIAVAEAGDVALLYTNAVPSDRITILYTGGDAALTHRTVVVNAPVRAVLPAPDGAHAVALLGQAEGSQHPGNFSLIPLAARLPPKLVAADAPPAAVAIGSSEALITTSGAVHDVFLARFPELSTTKTRLASKPLSAALVPDTGRGFVAQAHPEGRITFLSLEDGSPRTITGFELAAQVVTE